MASEPKYLHRFIEHALSALHHPEAFNEATYTRTLMSAAEASQTARGLVADGLRQALGGTSVPREAAERVLKQIGVLGAQTSPRPGVLALTAVKRDPSKGLPPEPTADWQALRETLTGFAEPETQTVLASIGPLLHQVAAAPTRPPARWDEDLQVYLSDGDVATIVEEALRHVSAAEPLLIARIRHSVMTTLWRQPLDPFV